MVTQVVIYETVTGNIVATPPVISYSYTVGLNDDEGSITLETSTSELTYDMCQPWQHSLAVIDGESVIAAGFIYQRQIDYGQGRVTLTAAGLPSLFKKRMVLSYAAQPIGPTTTGATATYATDGSDGRFKLQLRSTLAGIAFALVKQMCGDLPGIPDIALPSGSHYREYDGLDMQTLADRLSDLYGVVGAPQIRWDAQFKTRDSIIWAPVEVTDANRLTWEFPLDALGGVVEEWSVSEDHATACNRAWLSSSPEGNTNTALFARFDNNAYLSQTPPGVALIEIDTSHDNVSDPATLVSYARALATSQPYFTMNVKLARTDASDTFGQPFNYGTIRPGDLIRLTTARSFYGPVVFAGYIAQVSSDQDGHIALTVDRVSYKNAAGATNPEPALGTQTRSGGLIDRVKTLEAAARRARNPKGR